MIAPAPLHLGRVVVPCDQHLVVRITNQGDDEHVVDEVRWDGPPDVVIETRLELPRVLHPGGTLELALRVDADAPVTLDGELVVRTEAGEEAAPLLGRVAYAEELTESFVAPLPAVDVLLAVDHSGSMEADHGDELTRGLPHLVDGLTAVADWRLILVTDDSACANGPVLTPADPDAADLLAAHAFDPGGTTFSHALLELAGRALSMNAASECNATFQRDDAQLLVVAVSDAPEQSNLGWQRWVDDFFGYADQVVVSGVIDVRDTCGTGPDGYLDAAEATDGVVVDLCDPGWGADLGTIADGVLDAAPVLVLAAPALPDTVVVTAGGDPVPADLDPSGIVLTLGQPVPAGTPIEVRYAVVGECG